MAKLHGKSVRSGREFIMDLNFCLREMTHLRYFAPIVIEGKKLGATSTFYMAKSNKYNCPSIEKNFLELEKFISKYSVNLENISSLTKVKNNIITNEKSCMDIITQCKVDKKVTTTYQTDFVLNYHKFNYQQVYDMIMMPSENIADFYECNTEKNVYFGTTKYDVDIESKLVLEKYKLNKDTKKVLFIWPKSRDLHNMPISIIKNFNDLGWQVLIKSRGKDPIDKKTIKKITEDGNRLFFDDSWFPHTTQELLEVCDLVVNSGSTMIEECVMHNVPLINFDIKPAKRHGRVHKHRVTHSYLYDYDYCLNLKSLDPSFNTSKLNDMIQVVKGAKKQSFEKAKEEWLHNHTNSSKNLLNVLL